MRHATADPRGPLLPQALAFIPLAHARSPIDRVPDFIPVFGILDDALSLPFMIWVVEREPSRLIENWTGVAGVSSLHSRRR